MNRKMLLRTAGYISIGVGIYLLHKGRDDRIFTTRRDDIIDMEFTIIKD